jgi:hypothetical protein
MKFRGYDVPLHTTPVPDQFFDEVLAEIDNLAELKVVLYHMRRTFGFGKLVDRISYSQFFDGIKKGKGKSAVQLDRGTGLCLRSVNRGLKKALTHGYLVRHVVCPHCDQELSELKETERRGNKAKITPQMCPHCQEELRGKEHFYYAIPLSPIESSTLSQEAKYPHYKSYSRGTVKPAVPLLQLLQTQETDKQETGIQETDKQQTDCCCCC